jgi:CheY-like chemotaxis protein
LDGFWSRHIPGSDPRESLQFTLQDDRVYVTDTVLVVDDSTFIVEGLVALLRKTYRAIPSFGGEECLQILMTEMPSVIILDIMMEPMDGWETLSRIKDNPRTRHIPVLMFSAKKISIEEAEIHRIRIDDFLTKPVSPKELLFAVARILERQNRKKRTLSHWLAQGVAPEKIDEYLTLSSNLDIDTSLLAVMKKQLAHPSITELRREELTSSVVMLEERIHSTTSLLEAFLHDNGVTVPADTDLPDIPAVAATPCELPLTPHEDDTGKIPGDNSVSDSGGSTTGGEGPAALPGISPAPAPDSPGSIAPSSREKDTSPDNPAPPLPEPAESVESQVPVNQDISDPDSGKEPAETSPSSRESGPRETDRDNAWSPVPATGVSADQDTVVDSPDVRDDEPVPESASVEGPSDFEGFLEPESRMEDHGTAGHSSGSPAGVSPGNEGSPLPGSTAAPLPETSSQESTPLLLKNDQPAVHAPDVPVHRPEGKIPSSPPPQQGTGSYGRGILSVIFRLLFRR